MSYLLIPPRHVLYFIQFLLPAIVFCVSEELVVLITPFLCLHLAISHLTDFTGLCKC